MAEKKIVVENLKIEYEGLFSIAELYKLIDRWFKDQGYDKKEIKNIEQVGHEGKYIELELVPWRNVSDYVKYEIKLRLFARNVKEVDVEKDGVKVKLNQGKVLIIIDGYFTTDHEGRWESRPTMFFWRTILDKYFYRGPLVKLESGLVEEISNLHTTLKAFLNLYRY